VILLLKNERVRVVWLFGAFSFFFSLEYINAFTPTPNYPVFPRSIAIGSFMFPILLSFIFLLAHVFLILSSISTFTGLYINEFTMKCLLIGFYKSF